MFYDAPGLVTAMLTVAAAQALPPKALWSDWVFLAKAMKSRMSSSQAQRCNGTPHLPQ